MSRKYWTDEKLIIRALNNKTDHARWNNIAELWSRPSQSLLEKCLDLIQSENKKEKILGIDILAQLGAPKRPYLLEMIDIYFKIMTDIENDEEILESLLFALGHNNQNLTPQQIAKLCSLYQHDHSFINQSLIHALGFIDVPMVIDILIQLSQDSKVNNRDWATFYLKESKRNNKKIRQALWNRIYDQNKKVRLEAIMGLAKRKDEAIKAIIKHELRNIEYSVGIFQAILDLNDPQFLPLLQKNLEQAKRQDITYVTWLEDLKHCIAELSQL